MQRYDGRCALVIVDLQNDFADPAGGLAVHGGANLVPIINGEIATARAAAAMIVFTQDWHPESTPHFARDGGTWPVHCVGGTWGAELHPEVDAEAAASAPRVRKGVNGEDGYSGFTMRDPTTGETTPTELEGLLRAGGIGRVVVCGLATDYCVKATALDAARLGFETAVLLDAMRPVELEAGDEQRAIDEMTAAGVLPWSTRMR
ncbi:MAG TPA: isochorismatase family protein [Candidatus Limnocylindrales bacterium]|nr:isochorismatase family protein [Candidatus Limnocylindrales bacterium]